jgi:hypothetical protein
MKYICGELSSLNDTYDESSSSKDSNTNVSVTGNNGNSFRPVENNLINNNDNIKNYTQIKNDTTSKIFLNNDTIETAISYEKTITELKNKVEEDSYRNKGLEPYYIFDFNYSMSVLKELDTTIDKTAKAQKVPKELLTAVLFREMMFLGQEDMLDGFPVIGGKSLGICQIGIENVRYNENTVHGKKSVIINKTDDEIITMLQNPEQAVYFCAVQLRARAISLTGNKNVDLYKLDEKQIHKILEEYNQSKITKTIGPIKTKEKYAEETYGYYKLFVKCDELLQDK